jgi:hypothetical protein
MSDELAHLARSVGSEPLMGTRSVTRNGSNRLQARIEQVPKLPRLTAKRARSTWLVWHIERGTRLPELLAAAGVADVAALRDLARHARLVSEPSADRMLAGTS